MGNRETLEAWVSIIRTRTHRYLRKRENIMRTTKIQLSLKSIVAVRRSARSTCTRSRISYIQNATVDVISVEFRLKKEGEGA